ncbi:MAG: hypothetical protein HQL37_12155 [Alphaproteobacteria bacterium]|nr:hypothetical protein [Alphaproteobacteria bacterium]
MMRRVATAPQMMIQGSMRQDGGGALVMGKQPGFFDLSNRQATLLKTKGWRHHAFASGDVPQLIRRPADRFLSRKKTLCIFCVFSLDGAPDIVYKILNK